MVVFLVYFYMRKKKKNWNVYHMWKIKSSNFKKNKKVEIKSTKRCKTFWPLWCCKKWKWTILQNCIIAKKLKPSWKHNLVQNKTIHKKKRKNEKQPSPKTQLNSALQAHSTFTQAFWKCGSTITAWVICIQRSIFTVGSRYCRGDSFWSLVKKKNLFTSN